MHRNTKIATCCYCGTRAALVLGRDRHELICAGCGAPLHNLKAMPIDKTRRDGRQKVPTPDWLKEGARPSHGDTRKTAYRSGSYKKRKKRKSFGKRAFEEVFDLLEDIFD